MQTLQWLAIALCRDKFSALVVGRCFAKRLYFQAIQESSITTIIIMRVPLRNETNAWDCCGDPGGEDAGQGFPRRTWYWGRGKQVHS